MRQAFSFDNTESSTIAPATGVPMLDWPSDLFSDEASAADLVSVDLLCQSDLFRVPHAHVAAEFYAQIAA